jgi:hypothetical protein
MRTFMRLLIGILLVAVVVGLGVLVAQNGQSEQFTFLGTTFQGKMGWLAAGAVALGFVLAVLMLIPGRLASAWRGWWLGRRGQEVEDRLQALREQHAELEGSHRRLVEEHQRVLQQGPTPVAAGRERDAAPLPRTGPIVPPGSARGATAGAVERHQQRAPLDRLGERITALRVAIAAKLAGLRRSRRGGDTDEGGTPQGPTAATS